MGPVNIPGAVHPGHPAVSIRYRTCFRGESAAGGAVPVPDRFTDIGPEIPFLPGKHTVVQPGSIGRVNHIT